ncbi:MAG TPA: F0F1 ATP synthase subunit B [Spirochaetia bacterium]
MEALGRLGLDWRQFAAQLVNFLIIAWLIWRFLLKPLLANMKKRSDTIAKGLKDAEAARAALAEAETQRQKVLQDASAEAYRMLEAARDEAERVRAAAMERAGKDAERVIAEARAAMAIERRDMEKAVQALSLELSGKILEKAVHGLFSDSEKEAVVNRGLQRIGEVAGR